MTATGALSGVKVIDLSLLLPGPLATMYLGDMGADIIKIENPKIGDGTRYQARTGQDSYLYQLVNRNKKGITLNIKRPDGQKIFRQLLQDADIVVEGFRPGAMAKMGLGYDDLKDEFPGLIYCSISGYGATGPYRDLAGHDGNYISFAGLLSQVGPANGAPVIPGVQVADIGGGTLSALTSILAALYAREKNGKGQFLDISMMDGAFAMQHLLLADYLGQNKIPERGNWLLSGALPNYQVYCTKDKKYVILAALEERFFRNFLTKCGLEEYAKADLQDTNTLSVLEQKVQQLFANFNLDHWQQFFMDPDLCLSPVNDLAQALKDPQLNERGMVVRMKHPRLGEVMQIGSPFRFSKTPVSYRLNAPDHGEHNVEIFTQIGFSLEQIKQYQQKRII